MKLSFEEMMQKVEAIKAGETVLIDNVPVRAAWVDSDSTCTPCDICKMKCNLFYDMNTICQNLDEYGIRYAYLVLDEKELAHSASHDE